MQSALSCYHKNIVGTAVDGQPLWLEANVGWQWGRPGTTVLKGGEFFFEFLVECSLGTDLPQANRLWLG